MTSTPAFIVDAVRTPIGRAGGGLSGIRPDDLAAEVLGALFGRNTDVDPARIGEVYLGAANGAGEDNRNVARMATLLAGLPTSVPGATVNRLCGSGLEAVVQGSRAIETGDVSSTVVGGVESMSRAPWVMLKPDRAFDTSSATMWSTTIGWRMANPSMPGEWTVPLGEGAELLADDFSIGREEQDAFAADSHRKADTAWSSGHFDREVVPVADSELERDESIRPGTTVERLAALRPVFRPGGTVTAGNSSPINDGAAALMLMNEEELERIGAQPIARIVSRATSALSPERYGLGPVEASRVALKRAGIGFADVDAVELNEAFAAQSLACLQTLPELDPSIVNPLGGALALGHPLGCSGARILVTLAHHLQRVGGRWGLATMCIGVGQGIAVVIENQSTSAVRSVMDSAPAVDGTNI